MEAGRNLDWEWFIDEHDPRYLCVIHDTAAGFSMLDTARACQIPYHEVREIRARLLEDLEEWMGPDAIADALRFLAGEATSSWTGRTHSLQG